MNNNLNSYLAGLLHFKVIFEYLIIIWTKHNPRFCITYSLNTLAIRLLNLIESGFIRYKIKDNACVLTVSPVIV